jgi:hypothetical protein
MYFGSPHFGDPTLTPRVPAPAGRFCCWCGEMIQLCDSGAIIPAVGPGAPELPYHEACYARFTIGSVGHQRRSCPCFGGQMEDPPGLSVRHAAEAALDEIYRQNAYRAGICLGCGHARLRHNGKACAGMTVTGHCGCTDFEENVS